ncbi:MAG: hypothetical protein KDC45_14445 [Bacteroidetes bacterium]|nr:hypothetical protein [Bacteroidota bacterium]
MKQCIIFLFMTVLLDEYLPAQSANHDLTTLVHYEKAFAAATKYLGVRNGFLMFFSDDALALDKTIHNYRADLVRRQAPLYPLQVLLEWAPTEGRVARSGDWGFLVGPYRIRSLKGDTRAAPMGWYFSLWKKQTDSTWKVYIDVGIQTPSFELSLDSLVFDVSSNNLEEATMASSTRERLEECDTLLNWACEKPGYKFTDWISPKVRMHRNGQLPILGSRAVVDTLMRESNSVKMFKGAEVSDAGDFGFTYGSYSQGTEYGHYVRVWEANDEVGWNVVFDILSPAP